ncbi:peptidylprolyl isomerase [Neogemmobacter tilapiae]|nr:peptidylprolyl isomerase [Gemmobacter tilapiae]
MTLTGKTMTRWTLAFTTALGLSLAATLPAPAQESPFAPRMIINDQVISWYELEQRMQFMRLLRAPGDLEKEALKALMEDRLRMQEAKKLGVELTEEQIKRGMEEFASRANLTADQFITALAQEGVAAETFRDFVMAGLAWRDVVRAKFGSQASATDTDIDRFLTNQGKVAGVQVLMSELVIPAPPGREDEVMALALQLSDSVVGEGAFASAAREYSASGSKGRGGRLDWLPLANLPGAIAPVVLGLAPGETSDPVAIPGAVALFQLRGILEESTETAESTQVEYAQIALPNDGAFDSAVGAIMGQAETCDQLYTALPGGGVSRQTATMAALPGDVAMALAGLDQGEYSTTVVQGSSRLLLMMCLRQPVPQEPEMGMGTEPPKSRADGKDPKREAIREQLINRKLGLLSDNWLADLRANAIIREP